MRRCLTDFSQIGRVGRVGGGAGRGRTASKNEQQGWVRRCHRINVTARSRHAPTLPYTGIEYSTGHIQHFLHTGKGGTGRGGGEGRGKGEDRRAGYMNAAGDGLKPTPSCKEI